MKVFISSTVYDLIDIRAELAELLRAQGVTPVLSDDPLSDFDSRHPCNSIRTCLINIESCDEVIIILDQRYGPRLGKYGFEDVSATHLEYKKAMELAKPIHFYVRDRLEADYSIWKRNGRSDKVKNVWIKSDDDYGLFECLDERIKLKTGSHSNWYSCFTSSIDLKAAIAKLYKTKLLPVRLVHAIQTNTFPMFNIKLNATCETIAFQKELTLRADLTNVGGGLLRLIFAYTVISAKKSTRIAPSLPQMKPYK